jgi:glycosyltransferase involved in cell wall biosynthesis
MDNGGAETAGSNRPGMTRPTPMPKRRVRLAVVTGSLDVGGTERHLSQVLPHLAGSDFSITVLTLSHKGPLAEILEVAGIQVLEPATSPKLKNFRPIRAIVASVWLYRTLRRMRPDIVHMFLPEAYLIGGPISVLLDTPVRLMSRRSLNLYQRRRPVAAWFERQLHKYMTMLLGNSSAVTQQLEAESGRSKNTVRLIYNGVDTSIFANSSDGTAIRRSLGIAEDALVYITVANLIPYKGHSDEIAAFGQIADRLPQPWRLLIVGQDNGIGESLRAEARGVGIADNIAWLGRRNDVADLLRAADIGVLASHEEGFSNSVLEGLAAGLPMVVTNVGGNREIVVDGVTGRIVPPHDPDRLGEALLDLATRPEERRALADAAQRRISDQFTMAACIEAYRTLYSELADDLLRGVE